MGKSATSTPDRYDGADGRTRSSAKGNSGFRGSGATAGKSFGPDQARMLPASSIDAARLDHAIRCASELSDPEDAIRRIGSLWQTVDSLASLAESRMRALLARVKGPELTPEPSWLTAAGRELLGACDAESGAPSRAALESASRLARALLTKEPDLRADLECAPAGSVLVRWRDSSLRWLVSTPRLPWPGVSVRAYARTDPALPRLEQETFHYVPLVLEHAKKNL